MNSQEFANTWRRPHARGKGVYGTPNHWTTSFVEQLAVHKTVNATLKATGTDACKLYARMKRDEQFRLAVEAARTRDPRYPGRWKPKATDVDDLL